MISGPDMESPVYNHCGAVFKLTRQIYFVGGVRSADDTPGFTTQVFVIDQGTFSTLPEQLSVAKSSLACYILEEEGILIAGGGHTSGWMDTDSVEILDLMSGIWTDAESMPSAGVYVWTKGEFLFNWDTKLYQYDQASNEWAEIEDIPFDLNEIKPNFIEVDATTANVC